jgi:hypothetical protein
MAPATALSAARHYGAGAGEIRVVRRAARILRFGHVKEHRGHADRTLDAEPVTLSASRSAPWSRRMRQCRRWEDVALVRM